MTVVLHTLESEDSRRLFLAARASLRHFADAAESFAEEAPGSEEAEEARMIADALRSDSLSALKGRAPLAPIRHLPSLSRKVREIAEEIHGADPGAMCPILAADGVAPTDAQAARRQNGRERGAEMRATSERCPLCLASDVTRTIRKDHTRDAEIRWNRRGA